MIAFKYVSKLLYIYFKFERHKSLDIFYLLIKKNEKIYEQVMQSLGESLAVENIQKSSSYLCSLRIIEYLVDLYLKDPTIDTKFRNSFRLNEKIFAMFENLLSVDDISSYSHDFFLHLFETLNIVINKANSDAIHEILIAYKIMEKLLDLFILREANFSTESNIILKLSFVFRVFTLKYVNFC